MKKHLLSALLILNVLFAAAQQKAQTSNILTEEQKIYGLSKFWHEVRENFVFINQVGIEKWDSIYQSYIPLARQTTNDWEYYKLLQHFCAHTNDGHTGIMRPPIELTQTEARKPGEVFLPERDGMFEEGVLLLMKVAGKASVIRVNKNLGKEIPAGSQVHTVNNLPVEEYINRYTLPYVNQSTDHIRANMAVRSIVNGVYGDTLRLGYTKPDGKEGNIKLTFGGTSRNASEGEDLFYIPTNPSGELVSLEWQDNNIALIKLNSFSNKKIVDDFKQILPKLQKAKGLIIDLRFNGGGDTYNGVRILQYFVPDDVLYGMHSRSRMTIPSYKAWGNYMAAKDTINSAHAKKSYLAAHNELYHDFGVDTFKVEIDNKEKLIIPTVILTNNYTASAAEDFLIYADKQKHMIRMGQKTFGSTGQPVNVPLVAGLGAYICTKEDTYTDGRKFVGVGVLPHIEVTPTMDDYLKGKDVEVGKACEYIKEKLTKK